MTPEEFRAALKDLGMRQNFLARAAGMSRYIKDRNGNGIGFFRIEADE